MSKLKDLNLDDLEELLSEDDNDTIKIDWGAIIRKLYSKRKLFLLSLVITILIVYPLARTTPKYFMVEVKLAPELSSASASTSGLSSIMKTMGLSKISSNTGSDDAILPNLYPDLMNSKSFLVSLFDIPVQSKDGEIKCNYYEYLAKHQKHSAVSTAIGTVIGSIASLLPSNDMEKPKAKEVVNAGALTKTQERIAMLISKKVVCDVDKKTGVIAIDVIDQDPVICATIADSTCNRLQEFITEYRTKKSRLEMENAQKQYAQAKKDYLAAKQKAEDFNDSNWDLVDEDLMIEKQALQNSMQMCFANMSTFNQQYLASRAKYESLRPVYTILDGASVPLKPAGPSRMKVVIVFLVFVLGGEMVWVLFFADFRKKLKEILKEPVEADTTENKEL